MIKKVKVFQWLSKLKFISFMTEVNLNNGNETKSKNFPFEICKSEIIFLLSKNVKIFQWLSKPKLISFMTKVNPSNENETKSNIYIIHIFNQVGIYSNLTSFFICHKILKYFNDFYNWHLSILLQIVGYGSVEWRQLFNHRVISKFFLFWIVKLFVIVEFYLLLLNHE